jgi:hypothetical protein
MSKVLQWYRSRVKSQADVVDAIHRASGKGRSLVLTVKGQLSESAAAAVRTLSEGFCCPQLTTFRTHTVAELLDA